MSQVILVIMIVQVPKNDDIEMSSLKDKGKDETEHAEVFVKDIIEEVIAAICVASSPNVNDTFEGTVIANAIIEVLIV